MHHVCRLVYLNVYDILYLSYATSIIVHGFNRAIYELNENATRGLIVNFQPNVKRGSSSNLEISINGEIQAWPGGTAGEDNYTMQCSKGQPLLTTS